MVQKMKGLLVLGVLFYSAFAVAEEPMGFAEFPWSTSRSELLRVCNIAPRDDRKTWGIGSSDIYCYGRAIDIGGQRRSPLLLFTERDQLGSYVIESDRYAYRELRQLAIEKFGTDGTIREGTYTTARGIAVTGETIDWRWATGTAALLEERCGRLDKSCLTVVSQGYSAWFADQERARLEKARKAF